MAQSYSNYCGTGWRSGDIGVTFAPSNLFQNGLCYDFVDGNTTSNLDYFTNALTVDSTVWIQFDFGASRTINEAKWYQSDGSNHGSWKWQGSADASSWTDIGSSFTLGGSTTQTQTQLSGNSTGYRYYRLVGVSGATSWNSWLRELEFSIDSGVTDSYPATAYANAGGTGDRSAIITASTNITFGAGSTTNLIDGSTASVAYFNGVAASGKYLQFDFGASRLVREFRWRQTAYANMGLYKWQGSNNGSSWTDVGTQFYIITTDSYFGIPLNSTSYRYWRLIGVSGNISQTPYIQEIDFRLTVASQPLVQYIAFVQGARDFRANSISFLLEAPTPNNTPPLIDPIYATWEAACSEAMTIAESVQAGAGTSISVSESMTIGESVSGSSSAVINVSESLTISEATSEAAAISVNVAETLSILESLQTNLAAYLSVTSHLTISESSAVQARFNENFAESLAILDEILTKVGRGVVFTTATIEPYTIGESWVELAITSEVYIVAEYLVGNVLKLCFNVKKPYVGLPVDPETVGLHLKDPAGTVTAITPAPGKVATGRYEHLLDTQGMAAGEYHYRWQGDGSYDCAAEGVFTIDPTEVEEW